MKKEVLDFIDLVIGTVKRNDDLGWGDYLIKQATNLKASIAHPPKPSQDKIGKTFQQLNHIIYEIESGNLGKPSQEFGEDDWSKREPVAIGPHDFPDLTEPAQEKRKCLVCNSDLAIDWLPNFCRKCIPPMPAHTGQEKFSKTERLKFLLSYWLLNNFCITEQVSRELAEEFVKDYLVFQNGA